MYGWNIPAGQGSHCASTHEKRWPAAQDRTSGDDARVTCTIFTVRITAAETDSITAAGSWLLCPSFDSKCYTKTHPAALSLLFF